MLRSRIGGVVLVAGFLLAPQLDAHAAGASSPVLDVDELPDPLGRGLVVRVADDVPDAELIRTWIEQRGQEVLGERRVALETRDLIRVAVRGDSHDYHITLQVRRRGKDLPDQPDPVICECGSEEMLTKVGEAIDRAADQLLVAAARERRAKQLEAQRRAALELDERSRASSRRRGDGVPVDRYHPAPLGVAGIALLSTGTALLVGGIGITATEASSGRRSAGGLSMIGVGSTSWLTGLTMLIVDVARCRRAPGRCQAPRGMAKRSVVAAREGGR